jgi:hypothetical protein
MSATVSEASMVIAVCPQHKNDGVVIGQPCDAGGWAKAALVLAVSDSDTTVTAQLQSFDTDKDRYDDMEGVRVCAGKGNSLVTASFELDSRRRFVRVLITAGTGVHGARVSAFLLLSKKAEPAEVIKGLVGVVQ